MLTAEAAPSRRIMRSMKPGTRSAAMTSVGRDAGARRGFGGDLPVVVAEAELFGELVREGEAAGARLDGERDNRVADISTSLALA